MIGSRTPQHFNFKMAKGHSPFSEYFSVEDEAVQFLARVREAGVVGARKTPTVEKKKVTGWFVRYEHTERISKIDPVKEVSPVAARPVAQVLRLLTQDEAKQVLGDAWWGGKNAGQRRVDHDYGGSDDGTGYVEAMVPLEMVRANEAGDRYDGTVGAELMQQYAQQGVEAPVHLLFGARAARRGVQFAGVNDGGHRVSAARLRGDVAVKAVMRLSDYARLLEVQHALHRDLDHVAGPAGAGEAEVPIDDGALMLDFSASGWCEQATGRKWGDLEAGERDFWRNEALVGAREWAAAEFAEQTMVQGGPSEPEPD